MKNNSFFTGRALVGAVACMLSMVFWSCEPEGIEVPTEQASMKAAKSDKGNLPHREIAQVRASVAPYHNFEKAMDAGWDFVIPYVPHMGYHWINTSLWDDEFEMLNPEVLIFVEDRHGNQRFVGVEYLVKVGDKYPVTTPPEGFPGSADFWEVNPDIDSWTLHLWIGLNNPDGIFEMHNINVPAEDPSEE